MAGRRGHNEGSIYQRSSDSRWTGAISLANGSRKVFYGKTKRDVRDKLQQAQAQEREGRWTATRRETLAAYLRTWLDHKSFSVRPMTIVAYQLSIDRVVPYIGNIRLDALRPVHFQDCYDQLRRGGLAGRPLSARSVEQTHTVMRTALRHAVRLGLLVANPAELVSPPRREHREMSTLSVAQTYQLFQDTEDDPLHALWVVLATTGLRLGEALGTLWTDVDLTQRRLVIRRALQRQRARGLVFVETKSASSRRTVELTDIATRALEAHRAHQEELRRILAGEWKESGVVFSSTIGTPVSPDNVRKRFLQALADADLPRVRLHDLRHTAATIMLQQGIHPRVVQEMLGHSSITLTLGTYSHVMPTMHREAADKLDDLFAVKT